MADTSFMNQNQINQMHKANFIKAFENGLELKYEVVKHIYRGVKVPLPSDCVRCEHCSTVYEICSNVYEFVRELSKIGAYPYDPAVTLHVLKFIEDKEKSA